MEQVPLAIPPPRSAFNAEPLHIYISPANERAGLPAAINVENNIQLGTCSVNSLKISRLLLWQKYNQRPLRDHDHVSVSVLVFVTKLNSRFVLTELPLDVSCCLHLFYHLPTFQEL